MERLPISLRIQATTARVRATLRRYRKMTENRQLVLYPRRLFQTIRNKGEGDCGPASLWQLLYGGQPTSRDLKEMRNQAVDEVYRNPSSYLGFFEGETEGARKGMLYRWTVNMSKKGVWADQLFINAVARAHQVNVRILVPNGNDTLRDEQGNYAGQGTAWRTYYMLHTGGCHFEALKILGKVMPIGCGAEQKSAEASTASTVESSSRVPPPLPPKPKPKPVEKVKKYRVY